MFGAVIVDDEFFVREMIKNSVDWNSHGFKIIGEASSAKQAIGLIQQLKPELVLLDINMPESDGFAVARAIRDMELPAKVVVLTGHNAFEFAKKAIQFQVYDYLLKPVPDAELSQLLTSVHKKITEEKAVEQTILSLSNNVSVLLQHVDAAALGSLNDEGGGQEQHRASKELVDKIKKYVHGHLSDEQLNVQTVSGNLFVNMSYMSSTFKKTCGQGLHSYIHAARMEKAYQIILATDASTKEVAAAVGFKNPVYFGKCLKKHFGRSFLEIRRIQRKYKKNS